jgi:N-acetylglucosamine kinase-like BadF-type ATPase
MKEVCKTRRIDKYSVCLSAFRSISKEAKRMKQDLFIGIDGGGTRSTAVAVWPNGQVAAISCGKGLNFHNIGVEKVRTRLEGLVQDLCAKADAPVGKVCVGMSALDGPADENTLSRFRDAEVSIFRLDHSGTVIATTDGETLAFAWESGGYTPYIPQ